MVAECLGDSSELTAVHSVNFLGQMQKLVEVLKNFAILGISCKSLLNC